MDENHQPKRRQPRHLLFGGVALAILIAFLIYAGSYSAPARVDVSVEEGSATAYSGDLLARFDSDPDSLSNEEYVEAARRLDEQLLAELAQRKANRRRGRAAADPFRKWEETVRRRERELAAFDRFPEGSLQSALRDELERLKADRPSWN